MESEPQEQDTPEIQETRSKQEIDLQCTPIKRIDATFEIEENGISSYTTPKINGTLKAVLLDLEGQTEIQVYLRELSFIYPIYKNTLKAGFHYLPIRTEAIAPDGQRLLTVGHEYGMVDGLDIIALGSKGKRVMVVVHYV